MSKIEKLEKEVAELRRENEKLKFRLGILLEAFDTVKELEETERELSLLFK